MNLTIVHLLLAWSYATAFQFYQQKQKLLPPAFLPLWQQPQRDHVNDERVVATRRTRSSLLSMTINTSNDNRSVLMNAINNDNDVNDSNYKTYDEPVIDKYGRITWTEPTTTTTVTTTTKDSNIHIAPEMQNQSESSQLQEAVVADDNYKNVDTSTIPTNTSPSETTKTDYSIHRKLLEFRRGSKASTADQNEGARIEAETVAAAAEREEAARMEAEAKAAAEREEAARIEAEAKEAAEREEAASIEEDARATADERDDAASIEEETKAAAEREEAARIEVEEKAAAAEREEAARIEAEAKAASEREEATRLEAEAAAEREEAARIEAEAKASAEREEASARVEEQLTSTYKREDSTTMGEDNMLGGLMSSIEKKLREENIGLGLKRTDFAPPIPPPPDVAVDKTVAVALKRSNAATKKPARFLKVEATSSATGKVEKSDEKPDDKKSSVLSMIKGKKDALLRIAKEKPKLVVAAALILVLVPRLIGVILRRSMR